MKERKFFGCYDCESYPDDCDQCSVDDETFCYGDSIDSNGVIYNTCKSCVNLVNCLLVAKRKREKSQGNQCKDCQLYPFSCRDCPVVDKCVGRPHEMRKGICDDCQLRAVCTRDAKKFRVGPLLEKEKPKCLGLGDQVAKIVMDSICPACIWRSDCFEVTVERKKRERKEKSVSSKQDETSLDQKLLYDDVLEARKKKKVFVCINNESMEENFSFGTEYIGHEYSVTIRMVVDKLGNALQVRAGRFVELDDWKELCRNVEQLKID